MQTRWIGVLTFWMILVLFAGRAEAELKVGVVDLQKAMERTEEGKKAKDVFKNEVEKIQRDLKTRQDELNKLKEELERQSLLLSESARYEKQKSYEDKLKDFKRVYEDYQEEMRRKDAELSEKILRKLVEIIEALGEKKGFDLIFEKTQSAVLYKSKKVDITDDVIQMANEEKAAP